MRRRFLLIFFALVAVVLLFAATLPLWLGVALRATPDRLGLSHGRYERLGYARFALHDVVYQRGNVRVTVDRAEADSPLLWFGRRLSDRPRHVVAGRWLVDVKPSVAKPPPPTTDSGWVPLQATLRRVADIFEKWLPTAEIGAGTVRWSTGEVTLASASWKQRVLLTKNLVFKATAIDGTAEFPAGKDEIKLSLRKVDSTDALAVKTAGSQVEGSLSWWDQPATVTARFGPRGWLPAQATVRAENWNVPAAQFKLGETYSRVRATGQLDWSDAAFRAEVSASSEPLAGNKAPPLDVQVRGRGDFQAFTLDAFRATAPGLSAVLTEAVTVERSGKFRDGAAQFRVEADLTKQPWFTARGLVRGEAQLFSEGGAAPAVAFKLNATDVAAEGVAINAIATSGRLQWPKLDIAEATLVGLAGEQLQARGGWDFKAKELSAATVSGTLRRQTLARWLPASPDFEWVKVSAAAAGPLATLRHEGEVSIDRLSFSGVKPLAASATWRGAAVALEKVSIRASAGTTTLAAEGASDRASLRLTALQLAQGGVERLRLAAPAAVRWQPALHVEEFNLVGPEAALDADVLWGPTGRAKLAVRNISSSWFTDLVALPGPAWRVSSLGLTGTWDRGPMTFSAVFGAAIALGQDRSAAINLSMRGDKDGIRLEALRAAEGNESIIHATGKVPVVLMPGGKTLVSIEADAPIAVEASTAPNAAFWQELATLTGVELKSPRVAAHVKGTWRKPEGDLRFDAERVAVDPKRFKQALPTVEAIHVEVLGGNDGVRLERFSLRVEGQEVRASGRLPIGEGEWAKVFKEPLAALRRGADFRLEIPDADISALARVLPAMLAPKGRMSLDVAYRAGALDGSLRLADAATRPLGPLGVLQEIAADIRLSGQSIELRSVQATSGGEAVQLTGRVELPALNLAGKSATAAASAPVFDVALKGTNLPFVRRTGLLVRGDLDLKLTTTPRGGEVVSGTVRLRDSLFLQDMRGLLPGGGAQSKSRRPPYFSVETVPINAWRLDVSVEGDQFMRIRTPVFNGIASMRFKLGGTLEDPLATGEATIDEGRVRLPFAPFDVQSGRVALTAEQPYEPQIAVAATARRFGYDVRMELNGAATAPVLTFTSNPPLEHGQVLLMVMAGESPRQEVSTTDQQRAAKLGAFLGQSLLASFGGDSENADRLSISSGEKVSRQGRETYDIEYRLNERWSVTGEYDEFDEYNAGVKWRVYSRDGKVDDKPKGTPEAPKPDEPKR